MRRAISIVVTTLLAVLVGSTIVVWASGSSEKSLHVVGGVVDSDATGFFRDPKVQAVFADHGVDVRLDRSKLDFAFGTGTSATQHALSSRRIAANEAPFSSPLAVATFSKTARLLERAGVAQDHGGWWTLDMKGFLDLAANLTRWDQLPGNAGDADKKLVGITSTNVATSNAAAMYALIASYVANQNRVLDTPARVDAVVNEVTPLFLGQRDSGRTTEALFRDYLSSGEDTHAMVMISEAQFLARAAAGGGRVHPNMVLMYPDPDVLAEYALVPLTTAGKTVGRLLTEDAGLQRLAAEHGLRPANAAAFDAFVRRHKLPVPRQVGDVIESPRYAITQALMTRIDAALHVKLGPRPGPATTSQSLTVAAPVVVP